MNGYYSVKQKTDINSLLKKDINLTCKGCKVQEIKFSLLVIIISCSHITDFEVRVCVCFLWSQCMYPRESTDLRISVAVPFDLSYSL